MRAAAVAVRRLWAGPRGREVVVWQQNSDTSLHHDWKSTGDDGRPLPLGTATQLAEYLGVVMARRSVQLTPHDGARKSGRAVVVELGAGCGVVGLVAATHHGATAVLTDREIELNGLVNLDLLRLSIRENARSIEDAGGGAVVRRLRWGESSDVDALCESLPPTDIGSTWVVGSELVYDRSTIGVLVHSVGELLRFRGKDSEAILSAVDHRFDGVVANAFWETASAQGLRGETVLWGDDGTIMVHLSLMQPKQETW